jgi:hypothetical protein
MRDVGDPPSTGDPYIDCETCAGTGRVPEGEVEFYTQVGLALERMRRAYAGVMHAWTQRAKTPEGPTGLQKAVDELNAAADQLTQLRNA